MALNLGFVIGILGVENVEEIMEEEFSGPPLNVMVELLLGLVFCIWAALTVLDTFLSIHPHSEENRYAFCLLNV
ncbi:hypothetical protein L3X38_005971 [Prunus dulcis]|uniref:Uncharacterized protein n=1 Tax=Prunus dulcis TaxID=3755 RepID=A0AAD4ZRX7_PRUDU|nr:hypothetical protein L3X38_005971 [Prunus dulcis]